MQTLTTLPVDGLDVRPLTEEDFFEICRREDITVLEQDVPTSFYMRCDSVPVIVLKRSERGLRRLFSAFHELGHHFLHGGRSDSLALFRGSRESKSELEADAFAAIALCPATALQNFKWLDEHPEAFAARIWLMRNYIKDTYRI